MKKLFVIGDPVEHSKSPLIHGAMLEALGLDYIYELRRVPRGETALWVEEVKVGGYAGFNATIPHKEALVPLMDELDEDARLYGAVNTVCYQDGRLYGHNTDGQGFTAALTEAGLLVRDKHITLLGAGGAARAVALKLVQQGAARISVCNRTIRRAMELCAYDAAVLRPEGFDTETLARLAAESDLVVNCTSLGMTGMGRFKDLSFLEALPAHAAVCDLIYAPAETELLRQAREKGHKTMNGLGMLVWQAIFALEHFTGTKIDGSAMAEMLRKKL